MLSNTYTKPNNNVQNNIINLVKNILTYYENLSESTTQLGSNASGEQNLQNQHNDYIYYCHTEFDSNTTEFESLSNANKIVLKTKLNKNYIPGIMRLFQCIYDNNYWIFESDEWIVNIYGDLELNLSEEQKLSLLMHENTDEWIQVFDKFNENENYIDPEISDEENNYIGNERIYENIPSVDNSYTNIRKRQKVYTISDIKRLLDE
jgi:hypothetical protein